MKIIPTILLIVLATTAWGQTEQVDSLSFCHNKYKVPAECKAQSEYQLECKNYSIQWLYMNDEMLKTMPQNFISQLEGQMKKFKKEAITCYLLGSEVQGYRVSFKNDDGMIYKLIAYGVANGQPVLFQITLDKPAMTNEDIPEYASQMIKLTK